ncbi:hypothetical protein SAMN04488039_1103 [Sulfitobacter dubius]|nr:hypothetical protein SAMN04488039_1103 [Sulfitobacter dubius]
MITTLVKENVERALDRTRFSNCNIFSSEQFARLFGRCIAAKQSIETSIFAGDVTHSARENVVQQIIDLTIRRIPPQPDRTDQARLVQPSYQ